jgi:hypothetical protein
MDLSRFPSAIHLTREENRKLEWLAARRGKSAHAWAVEVLRRELAKHPEPPAIAAVADDDDAA